MVRYFFGIILLVFCFSGCSFANRSDHNNDYKNSKEAKAVNLPKDVNNKKSKSYYGAPFVVGSNSENPSLFPPASV